MSIIGRILEFIEFMKKLTYPAVQELEAAEVCGHTTQ